jgi:hypothetical protein
LVETQEPRSVLRELPVCFGDWAGARRFGGAAPPASEASKRSLVAGNPFTIIVEAYAAAVLNRVLLLLVEDSVASESVLRDRV